MLNILRCTPTVRSPRTRCASWTRHCSYLTCFLCSYVVDGPRFVLSGVLEANRVCQLHPERLHLSSAFAKGT
jgi:hypothetical protein